MKEQTRKCAPQVKGYNEQWTDIIDVLTEPNGELRNKLFISASAKDVTQQCHWAGRRLINEIIYRNSERQSSVVDAPTRGHVTRPSLLPMATVPVRSTGAAQLADKNSNFLLRIETNTNLAPVEFELESRRCPKIKIPNVSRASIAQSGSPKRLRRQQSDLSSNWCNQVICVSFEGSSTRTTSFN